MTEERQSESSRHAVVVGAGFGGIAAALRLRARGYSVDIFDRCERLGGRAQVYRNNGFLHDAGPTVITAPFLFEELFALFGESMKDHVTLKSLDTWYRFHFPDGSQFNYGGEVEDTLAEIRRVAPEDEEGYLDLLETSRRIYELGFEKLSHVPFHKLTQLIAHIPAMLRLGLYRTVWQLVCRHLRSEKLRQAFSIQPLLVGGNPFQTTSIYNLIHFLERKHGVHFAMGGTGALVDALGDLMRRQGIRIHLGKTVTQICTDKGKVTGVALSDGRVMDARVVVSNTDPDHLYTSLLPQKSSRLSAKLKARFARKSMGLFVLFFGTTTQYEDVEHHTIWLGQRYKGLLDDIFKNKVLADDFSMYLHRPTATDPSFAPDGCDSFYALVPVPNLSADIDWSVEGPKLQSRMVAALDRTILPGLSGSITSDFYMTPENFSSDYLSPDGAGFSVAPTFYQSAWFRFHNRAEGPRGLYLVGAGTHPGAGLPGVLSSAKVLDSVVPTPETGTQAHSMVLAAQ